MNYVKNGLIIVIDIMNIYMNMTEYAMIVLCKYGKYKELLSLSFDVIHIKPNNIQGHYWYLTYTNILLCNFLIFVDNVGIFVYII